MRRPSRRSRGGFPEDWRRKSPCMECEGEMSHGDTNGKRERSLMGSRGIGQAPPLRSASRIIQTEEGSPWSAGEEHVTNVAKWLCSAQRRAKSVEEARHALRCEPCCCKQHAFRASLIISITIGGKASKAWLKPLTAPSDPSSEIRRRKHVPCHEFNRSLGRAFCIRCGKDAA